MSNKLLESRKILGESPPIKHLLSMIHKVSSSKTNILIIGESGTGKELVARMIHESGIMKDEPFIPVNCGAIPETLIESEMFGHKKGSFTGAVSDKEGLFEAADKGTLFLDEVGELPLSMQVKLLRALQERMIRKVGSNTDTKVDVRIIAATNRNLEEMVAKGTFREDLYYRLNVIMIKTPPLRERSTDIEFLMNFFIQKFAKEQEKVIKGFDPETRTALLTYSWPGNVRELENIMERSVTLTNTEVMDLSVLPVNVVQSLQKFKAGTDLKLESTAVTTKNEAPSEQGGIHLPAPNFSKGPIQLDQILSDLEKTYVLKALEHSGGVKKKAAQLLGVTFRSIRYRLEKLGIESALEEND